VGGSGTDADVKALFDSLQVRQEGDRATLSAAIPAGFLKKMFSEMPEAQQQWNPQTQAKPATSEPH
jgi:hypothetical protein